MLLTQSILYFFIGIVPANVFDFSNSHNDQNQLKTLFIWVHPDLLTWYCK